MASFENILQVLLLIFTIVIPLLTPVRPLQLLIFTTFHLVHTTAFPESWKRSSSSLLPIKFASNKFINFLHRVPSHPIASSKVFNSDASKVSRRISHRFVFQSPDKISASAKVRLTTVRVVSKVRKFLASSITLALIMVSTTVSSIGDKLMFSFRSE